jgi:hypothetical protein
MHNCAQILKNKNKNKPLSQIKITILTIKTHTIYTDANKIYNLLSCESERFNTNVNQYNIELAGLNQSILGWKGFFEQMSLELCLERFNRR